MRQAPGEGWTFFAAAEVPNRRHDWPPLLYSPPERVGTLTQDKSQQLFMARVISLGRHVKVVQRLGILGV